MILNLADLSNLARDNYFNKPGSVWSEETTEDSDGNHNKKLVEVVFLFGPWVYWTKPEWDRIV